jgi:hypothetical protein
MVTDKEKILMDPENNESAAHEISSEAEQSETADSDAAPALNRAQRRAQAQGKKGASAANGLNSRANGSSGGPRPGGHTGQVRFPRTGHK